MDGSRCDASSRRADRGRFVLEVSQLVALQFVLRFRTPSCMRTLALWVNENSSACRKASEELPVYLLLGAITLASLLRPRGAERVEYEGIRYSQRGGIYNNLVGIKNFCVERHAPGLVANGAAAVLTRGLGTVTVAVKPRGWSLVRHKCYLTLIPVSHRQRVAQIFQRCVTS
jgi:hypothetical protein